MSPAKPPTTKARAPKKKKAPSRPAPARAAAPVPKTGAKAAGRGRIDQAALLAALEAHILGEREMSSSQVSAALALLKKFLSADEPKTGPAAHEDALSLLDA